MSKFVVILLLLRWATMEHASVSGVQLSVGAEMEAYGDPAAAASNHHAASLGRSRAGNVVNANRVVQLARSDRG